MLTRNEANDVLGNLSYLVPQAEKPFHFMYQPPPDTLRQNCQYRQHICAIQTARSIADSISLTVQGFELHHAPTGITDLYDPVAIADTYFPQVEELACAITGGTRAFVFDHKLRMREQGRPLLTFRRHGDDETPSAVRHVHLDYTEASGEQRLRLTYPPLAADRPFMILGLWRPILTPPLTPRLPYGTPAPSRPRIRYRLNLFILVARAKSTWLHFRRLAVGNIFRKWIRMKCLSLNTTILGQAKSPDASRIVPSIFR